MCAHTCIAPLLFDILFNFRFSCSNPVFGLTLNPYDPSRAPGGSSGGEGALIGGGGSLVGIGSDIGGSVRIPCQMCGIYGLKPTQERLL